MTRDPLGQLRVLRAGDTDAARRALADVVTALGHAEIAVHDATGHLQAELDAALDGDAGDGAVEAYMHWLPVGRRALDRAAAREATLVKELDVARATLGVACASERAVEAAVEHRRTETRRQRQRSEQHELDEAALRQPCDDDFSETDA